MKKRRYERIEVPNLVANLSDGVEHYSGDVIDVSRVGMLLTNIPQEFNNNGETMTIIVSADGKDFKMLVQPRWENVDDSERKIGLVILDAPLDWTVFVMNREPEEEDFWAATTNMPDC